MTRFLHLSPLRAAFVAVAAMTLLVSAQAGVNVAISNGEKVSGTLNPADEIETFRMDVPAGAVFVVKLKGRPIAKKKPKPAVQLRLLDPDGQEVAKNNIKTKKSGATLKGYRAEQSGTYRLQVVGDGETPGEYKLVAKWKSPRKFSATLDDAGGGDESELELALDAGAAVTIKLKALKGSGATPVGDRLDGADEFTLDLDAPQSGSGSHVLKKIVVPVFGDVRLVATGGGAYAAKVKVKPPKPPKRSTDLTSDTIGRDPVNGGDEAFGQVIGGDGGVVVIPGGTDSSIVGTQVTLPPGALGGPVPILVGTSTSIPPQTPGTQGAGPTVFMGPEGLEFSEPVTVTIPFDAEAFDDADDLRVYTRDEDGNVTEIVGAVFDLENGLCTFPVSHFSSFTVFGPTLPEPATGDLDYDTVGDLVLRSPDLSKVYVYRGGIDPALTTDTSTADWVLTGANVGTRFGEVIVPCDLNGDGREDLVVSAPSSNIQGRVYVFFGGSGFQSRDVSEADAVISPQPGDFSFGIRIATGDVNDDGFDDLVVGAEGSGVVNKGAGAAYVFLGREAFSSRVSSDAEVILAGKEEGEGFGASMSVGDVTGDGIQDIVVGADQIVGFDQGKISDGTGKVFVFAGRTDLKSLNSRQADFTLSGEANRDAFGLETAVGDVDGDGIADIIVSAAGNDAAGTEAGAVYVYFGGSLDQAPMRLEGEAAGNEFGFAVMAADLDGDLDDEVIVTSKLANGGRGRAYIFAGTNTFASRSAAAADSILSGAGGGASLDSLQLAWDVDGLGIADLVLYASGAAGGNGVAYVFPGAGTLPATGDVDTAPVQITGQPGEALGGSTN